MATADEEWQLEDPPEEEDPSYESGLATTFGQPGDQVGGVPESNYGYQGDYLPETYGVSFNENVLRQQFGDPKKAYGQPVEVTNPATGKTIIAPIVDVGPADWVINRQGPTIDLTEKARQEIGGTGQDKVKWRFIPGKTLGSSDTKMDGWELEGGQRGQQGQPQTDQGWEMDTIGFSQDSTGQMPSDQWQSAIRYANQYAGVRTEVAHGIERGHSDRHSLKPGQIGAADVDLFDAADGHKLNANNPDDRAKMSRYIEAAVSMGVTGVGQGDDYMGPSRIHVGGGFPATWGAGGRGQNAPKWLREAYANGKYHRPDLNKGQASSSMQGWELEPMPGDTTAAGPQEKPATGETSTGKEGVPQVTPDYTPPTDVPGLVEKPTISLSGRPIIRNEDGSVSSELSMSFEEDGKEVLIPTIVNGTKLSEEAAIDHYKTTGEHMGKFKDAASADAYAEKVHNRGMQAGQAGQEPAAAEAPRVTDAEISKFEPVEQKPPEELQKAVDAARMASAQARQYFGPDSDNAKAANQAEIQANQQLRDAETRVSGTEEKWFKPAKDSRIEGEWGPAISTYRDSEDGKKLYASMGRNAPTMTSSELNGIFGLTTIWNAKYAEGAQQYDESMRKQGKPIDPKERDKAGYDKANESTPWHLAEKGVKKAFMDRPRNIMQQDADTIGEWTMDSVKEVFDKRRDVGSVENFSRAMVSDTFGLAEAVNRYLVMPFLKGADELAKGIAPDSAIAEATDKANKYWWNTIQGQERWRKELAVHPETEKASFVSGMAGSMGAMVPDLIQAAAFPAGKTAEGVTELAPTVWNAVKSYFPTMKHAVTAFILPSTRAGMDAQKESAANGESPVKQVQAWVKGFMESEAVMALPLAARSALLNPIARFASRAMQGAALAAGQTEAARDIHNAYASVTGGKAQPFEPVSMLQQAIPMAVMGGVHGEADVSGIRQKLAERHGPPSAKNFRIFQERQKANLKPGQYRNFAEIPAETPGTPAPTSINVGLNIQDMKNPRENAVALNVVHSALKAEGVDVVTSEVQQSKYGEPTAVVSIRRPMNADQAHRVATRLKQEAIAQKTGEFAPALYGREAKAWGDFKEEEFLNPTKPRTGEPEPTTGTQTEQRPAAEVYAAKEGPAEPAAPVAGEPHPSDTAPLKGAPTTVKYAGGGEIKVGPSPKLRQSARDYMNRRKQPYTPPTTYVKVSPEDGKAAADAYTAMLDVNDPKATPEYKAKVKKAYDALKQETKDQYTQLIKDGYTFNFMPEGKDPYKFTPQFSVQDVQKRQRMSVYPTEAGFGAEKGATGAHPMLEDTGLRWGQRAADGSFKVKPVTYNDLFRAVHDVYGHAKEGVGFREHGEDNAYLAHSAMYSPEARRALATETRGQNSWVNFGPYGLHNRRSDTGRTIFAPQKVGILPQHIIDRGTKSEAETKPSEAVKPAAAPVAGEKTIYRSGRPGGHWWSESESYAKGFGEKGRPSQSSTLPKDARIFDATNARALNEAATKDELARMGSNDPAVSNAAYNEFLDRTGHDALKMLDEDASGNTQTTYFIRKPATAKPTAAIPATPQEPPAPKETKPAEEEGPTTQAEREKLVEKYEQQERGKPAAAIPAAKVEPPPLPKEKAPTAPSGRYGKLEPGQLDKLEEQLKDRIFKAENQLEESKIRGNKSNIDRDQRELDSLNEQLRDIQATKPEAEPRKVPSALKKKQRKDKILKARSERKKGYTKEAEGGSTIGNSRIGEDSLKGRDQRTRRYNNPDTAYKRLYNDLDDLTDEEFWDRTHHILDHYDEQFARMGPEAGGNDVRPDFLTRHSAAVGFGPKGNIYFLYNPTAVSARELNAQKSGISSMRVSNAIIGEEQAHAAWVGSLKKDWIKETGGLAPNFNNHVRQELKLMSRDMRETIELAPAKEQDALFQAISDSENIYLIDPDRPFPDRINRGRQILEDIEHSIYGPDETLRFGAEFLRQVRQIQKKGLITEETRKSMFDTVGAWVDKALKRIYKAFAGIKDGAYGKAVQDHLQRMEDILAGKDVVAHLPVDFEPSTKTRLSKAEQEAGIARAEQEKLKSEQDRKQIKAEDEQWSKERQAWFKAHGIEPHEGTGEMGAEKKDEPVKRSMERLRQIAKDFEKWKDWYGDFDTFLDSILGKNSEYKPLIKSFMAATSPGTKIGPNVQQTIEKLQEFLETGSVSYKGLGQWPGAKLPNLRKAMEGLKLGGLKVGPFDAALQGDRGAAAIDRHVAMVLFRTRSPSDPQIRKGQEVARQIAAELGWDARQVQAAWWAAGKEMFGARGKVAETYEQYLKQSKDELNAILTKDREGKGRGLEAARRLSEGARKAAGAEGDVGRIREGERKGEGEQEGGVIGAEPTEKKRERPQGPTITPFFDVGDPLKAAKLLARGHPFRAAKELGDINTEAFSQSASDRFIDTPGLEFLGNAMKKHVDRRAMWRGKYGEMAHRTLMSVPRLVRGKALQEYRDYWETNQIKGRDAANAMKLSPGGRSLVNLSKRIYPELGRVAVDTNIKIKNPDTGRYEPFQEYKSDFKDYHPHRLQERFQKAIDDPSKYPDAYDELMDMMGGPGITKAMKEARLDNYKASKSDNGFFGSLERKRTSDMPSKAYDYSFREMIDYIDSFAERVAQVEAYGQGRGKGNEGTVWDEAINRAGNRATRELIEEVRGYAYGERVKSKAGRAAMIFGNYLSGIHLGNPISAFANLASGEVGNLSRMGPYTWLKSLPGGIGEVKGAYERGNLLHDFGSIMHDGEQQGGGVRFAGRVAGGLLKGEIPLPGSLGGPIGVPGVKQTSFNAAEQWIRGHSIRGHKMILRAAIKAYQKNPSSSASRQYLGYLKRMGFRGTEAQDLILEGGHGELYDRYLRASVNKLQGGYTFADLPVFMSSPAGKVFGKYGPWGIEQLSHFRNEVIKPAVRAVTLGRLNPENVTIINEKGARETMSVPGSLMPMAQYIVAMTLGGLAIEKGKALFFGIPERTAKIAQILGTFKRNKMLALNMALEKVFMYNVAAGATGTLGNIVQSGMDINNRARFKNPLSPPAFSVAGDVANTVMDIVDQNANPDAIRRALVDLSKRQFGLFRAGVGLANLPGRINNAWGSEYPFLKKQAALQDLNWLKGHIRRYNAENRSLEKVRFEARVGKGPDSAFTDDLWEDLLIGDTKAARERLDKHLEGKTTEQKKVIQENLIETIRSRQPIRAGKAGGEIQRVLSKKWAEENLTPEDMARVKRIDENYRNSARAFFHGKIFNEQPTPKSIQEYMRNMNLANEAAIPPSRIGDMSILWQ